MLVKPGRYNAQWTSDNEVAVWVSSWRDTHQTEFYAVISSKYANRNRESSITERLRQIEDLIGQYISWDTRSRGFRIASDEQFACCIIEQQRFAQSGMNVPIVWRQIRVGNDKRNFSRDNVPRADKRPSSIIVQGAPTKLAQIPSLRLFLLS